MSLDVYLDASTPPTAPNSGSGIFIRRNGETVEISHDEWDRHFPGQAPVVLAAEYDVDTCVYSRNITHNLAQMADAAGIYKPLWRPDEIGITRAKELIEPLKAGLERLQAEPDAFKAHNPANGWGNYKGLVAFVADYLKACIAYPEASVRVSR